MLTYIRDGKITVGPWYILPDIWLVGQESLIRNLEYSYDLAKKLREQPEKELPVQDAWEGFCVLMFNPRSASIIPVPVGRHRAMSVDDSAAVEMMETRGWVVVDVLQKKGDNICPPPAELPTLIDIMDQY